jgi:ubiquinone/menaquinone biosynthesis C-methylase UbiE
VDQTPVYIKKATKLFEEMKNFSFEVGNVEDLPSKYPKAFDLTISRAVISWMPYYEDFIKSLFKVTKTHIFISSLFYDGDIDFLTKVKMYRGESGESDTEAEEQRNVYSLPRFKKFVMGLGAKNIEVTDFEINIDLPRAPVDQMSTYTEKLKNGKRLQISGAILMSWKWVRIDL